MMTPDDYIEKYNIQARSPKFDQQAFMDEFGRDFNQRVEGMQNYRDFQEEVHATSNDFSYILGVPQNKRGKLKHPLWRAFYAIYVVPKRKELFPEVQEKVEFFRRRNYEGQHKSEQTGD